MHAWEQIQITVDYIEEHLSENIKINDLAKMASLSQFYYQRLFSRLVKKPVNEYIKLRRLAKASEALQTENKRILDIALDYGFTSHESFTRSFKDAFGIPPEEYRANPIRLNNFVKPQLLLNYTLVDENVPLITDGIVLEITREHISSQKTFIGLTVEEPITQMPGCGETGVDSLAKLWDTFHESKASIHGIKENGEEIGVTFTGTKDGCYRYFAGAEANAPETAENFTTWELAKGEYIVCSFDAEDFEHLIMDAVYKAHKYLFETWLPNHKMISMPFAVERYASHTPKTTCMEIWVMSVPVTK
ncbi:AraC family transcriptional regulator [Anaerosacchariphilus polymeriproducens]|uniref:AraC family transcriptional regulator n=1 Tax=Anaerosacchariphilus polymeriproducens TaxID=1812858 RepID=A0A371AZQ0_9FIRM|nr:AraC family transcriptional regulator [Anaerosacchariphilus polymeriproducens]RDU24960.1 AraC family transcriptional regulator [Anaerosacchariphilus polymeriproducens]